MDTANIFSWPSPRRRHSSTELQLILKRRSKWQNKQMGCVAGKSLMRLQAAKSTEHNSGKGRLTSIRNLWRKAHTPTTDRSSENKSTLANATATATARSSTPTDSPFNSNQPVTINEKNNPGMMMACSSSRSSKNTLRRGVTMPALPEHNAVGSEADNICITGAPYSRAGRNLTSSQIEFFRLLDEKIAQGPDYDPLADS
ncbi:hypothetical protein T11_16100 [Trichinella zimbabwensis]|uniref:Uncharacterized protein n=1 Tax=Trichinella zimbabwensis TaxID=268475 RepID=A0A0V1HWP7_9BILA|nr:hypothetical protein T11_16100 [Trichinella zimbabwensis]